MSKRFAILSAVLLCMGAAVCLADSSPGPVAANSKQVTLADFGGELQRETDAVQQLRSHPENALVFHKSLPDNFVVRSNAQSYSVDMVPLKRALGEFIIATPQRRTVLLSSMDVRLSSMREAMKENSAPADFSSERNALAGILARREFRSVKGPTFLEKWRDKILGAILQFLEKLFRHVPSSAEGNRLLTWTLITIAICVLAVWLKRMSGRRDVEIVRIPIPFAPSEKHWRSWLADARTAATSGNWREAIHYAYWGGISHLEETGAWIPDRARTPREYLRLISPNNSLRPVLRDLTNKFELTWYGRLNAQPADYDAVLLDLEKLGCQ